MSKWIPDFKLDGISVPVPDNYSQLISDLSSDASGRTLDGIMHKDIIAVKSSVPFEWKEIEWLTAATIANAVDGKESVTCKYMDIRHPYSMSTMIIYIGDRECKPSKFGDNGKVYWDISLSQIET